METIGRDEVERLVADPDAAVVEVLARSQYEWAHLPGAVHLPYRGWDPARVTARLDREQPVAVYCNDFT